MHFVEFYHSISEAPKAHKMVFHILCAIWL
ncbi:Uncharacterised protein [Edwardsiella tarda]|nr:Uncharacterised protein [Edwardsiella tarda]